MKELKNLSDLKGGIEIIDFWAEWCSPCLTIIPILGEIEKELGINIFKVNIDKNPQLGNQYNIRSIPTLMVFKDKHPLGQVTGAYPKERMIEKIKEVLR